MLAAGHDVHVVTAAPEFTTEIASSRLHIRKVEQVVLDCVAVEPDALTVDRSASRSYFFRSLGKDLRITIPSPRARLGQSHVSPSTSEI